MESEINLPFKVGQICESKSFLVGFRGAWFRCKIIGIRQRKGYTSALLEHYDFPDEKANWTKLYQVPYQKKPRELILRPSYPPIYNENEMPDDNVNTEVAVIVNNSWKVGDLVDWWTTGCYWSGRILQLFDDDMAKIELYPPPYGEGLRYDICLKDVRPSLEWSLIFGWQLPVKGAGCSCARLIKPTNQVIVALECNNNAGQETEADRLTSGSSVGPSRSSLVSTDSQVASDEERSPGTTQVHKRPLGPPGFQETKDKSSRLGSGQPTADENLDSISPLEKYLARGADTLHSSRSDTLEAAIMDLEECATKIKLLKRILKCGTSPCDDSSQWKFLGPK